MRILKTPDYIVFDTETPHLMEFTMEIFNDKESLHLHTEVTDFQFLSKHFPSKLCTPHPIMKDFQNSFYYIIKD